MTAPHPQQPAAMTLQSYEFSQLDFRELLRAALTKGATLRFAAAGASMDPFIKDGDVVTVAPLPQRLMPGRIAAAVSPANGSVIIHRIIRIKEGAALLKGDNLGRADGYVPSGDLLGVVARVERGGVTRELGIIRHAALIATLSRWNLLRLCTRIVALVLAITKSKPPI
jgi:hypothetical protein